MCRAGVALAALVVLTALAASCSDTGYRPAYAVFRFTDANGQPIQVVGQRPQSTHEPGVVLKRNETVLTDGRSAVQELVVVDPLELPAVEYRLSSTPEGLVTVTGGSLEDYVVTPPDLL
jgi:hypothetical protein